MLHAPLGPAGGGSGYIDGVQLKNGNRDAWTGHGFGQMSGGQKKNGLDSNGVELKRGWSVTESLGK